MARDAALSPAALAPCLTLAPAVARPLPPPAMLATLLLVGGEVMLFAGLIFAFWVLRLAAPVWPPPLQPRLPIAVTALNTLVLLASSATLTAALGARRRRDRAAFVRGLGLTATLGTLFLAVQGGEWVRLVGFGLTVTSGTYGALFYVLVGTHAVHVVAALAWLGATLAGVRRGGGAGGPARLHACALYWHFVVALWPILFVCVYLP
jgi:heme/copper-type cytochrome/quinol oxidase subunit 3